ncbi:cyclic 3',5'-adenosine monophosphate phosphodiesterase [Chromobacterium violaceum]|uniref:Cyclic 3',5'-adenosine monophosphate phosphodiesterase n=2 Tax=Chromobacterium violaceum TaxID=536 RepID=A0AAX2MBJ8_CHRVL|nr:metallophosphoesterase [Chromobacterium violaceum]OLZ79736.1 metallophosphoesterase [Chromobacterium violaceum]STB64840.1 cyclic 3',5'-adenosine monophosphate phosphodiesterase [Chromobacterium violaceum]SUX33767.1 cyclic 3',5'-adenosine monophosphate phosphodiesterase [Chromobacterium violaceum]
MDEKRDGRAKDVADEGRREALGCLAAWSGAALVWTVVGGVPRAQAADGEGVAQDGLAFVQISDTHLGFHREANPDVQGSLRRAIADINALAKRPAFVVHTGDVSHLSRPEEFDLARQMLKDIRVDRVHTIPGEHDALDDGVSGYLKFFDHDGRHKAWYSFDQGGVHFVALNNVLNFSTSRLAALGDEQLAWLKRDLAGLSHSTPVIVLAHIPLWTVYEPWGWGTADAAQAMALLRPFGSVTVLNGHIHQVLQKVEGNVALHTARSLAYPLPTPGQAGFGEPAPVKVPAGELGKLLGTRQIAVVRGQSRLAMVDTPLDH